MEVAKDVAPRVVVPRSVVSKVVVSKVDFVLETKRLYDDILIKAVPKDLGLEKKQSITS
jgi:hypothetical protein